MSIVDKFRSELKKINPSFLKQWDKEGSIMLMNLRINAEGETMLHYVCNNLLVDLATVLLDFEKIRELVKGPIEESHYKKFVFAETTSGETALYQCLKKLEVDKRSDQLMVILAQFMKSNLVPSDYVNNRTGRQTTFVHMIVEREQVYLLINYIVRCKKSGVPMDFFSKDFFLLLACFCIIL